MQTGVAETSCYKVQHASLVYSYRYRYYLLTAIGLTPGGCSTAHVYTQTLLEQHSLVGRLSGIRTQSGQTEINDELTA